MSAHRDDVIAMIEAFAGDNEILASRGGRDGEVVLELPGERKLKTVCSFLVGDEEVSVSAFVIRQPDERHLDVYRFLLQRNLRLPGLAYAIDRSGDVYVVGRFPLGGLDADYLDRLCGVVLEASDTPFNDLLVLGFLTAMKREWRWRVARGESLRNLEAFRHLLEGCENDTPTHDPVAEPGEVAGGPRPDPGPEDASVAEAAGTSERPGGAD